MRCPLPIDWLDYLEGGSTGDLEAHLQDCQPCRLLVDELRRAASKREQLRLSTPPATKWPRWHESVTEFVAYGEIWWSGRMLDGEGLPLIRLPLLIVSDPWQEYGASWCEVVPLSTDVENATALDLLLRAEDSDLGVPWRALVRHQTTVRRQDLDARIGRLTDAGRSLMDEVVAGRAPEERFGVPIADAYDDRLSIPEGLEQAIRLLGRAFAHASEHEDVEVARESMLIYEFKPTPRPIDKGQVKLAADTTISPEAWSWEVEIPQRGRIWGRIEHKYANDELTFAIDAIEQGERGLPNTMWIVVWSVRYPEPVISEPFVPGPARRVVLGRDRGIIPADIARLELRLSE